MTSSEIPLASNSLLLATSKRLAKGCRLIVVDVSVRTGPPTNSYECESQTVVPTRVLGVSVTRTALVNMVQPTSVRIYLS